MIFIRNKQLIENGFKGSAKVHLNNILLTRKWNADYGGVYVKKTSLVKSNPYLENPDIKTNSGDIYTQKNPSLMTREISLYAEREGLFSYHVSILQPINPSNIPDKFEKKALLSFVKSDITEIFTKEKKSEKIYFRYMAPIIMKKSCQTCHVERKYKVGGIRGGISVKFDITEAEHTIKIHKYIIFIIGPIVIISLLGCIYQLTAQLIKKLNEAYKSIQEMAITDELTQLYNRRFFFEKYFEEIERAKRYKKNFSCIMIDIDHFKEFNDNYGHYTGDIVLREISNIIKSNCRRSDIAARYGGEEIVLILPETEKDVSLQVAEKIRNMVEKHKVKIENGESLKVTISIGVASFSFETLIAFTDQTKPIKYADEALYQAKKNGRNRVEIYNFSYSFTG